MKKESLIYVITFVATSVFLLGACKEENGHNAQHAIDGKVVHYTGCKNSREFTMNTPDSLSCVEYMYNANTQVLNLKHVNAGFNCGSDVISCNITLQNDTIIVEEIEQGEVANCLCLFDLNIVINNIYTQSYVLKFVEPLVNINKPALIFPINLAQQTSGTYCITRTYYPWSN